MNHLDSDTQDCIVARKKCCGHIVFATVNDKHTPKSDRETIGALAMDGLSIEHMPAAQVREQKWGCKCAETAPKWINT